LREPWRILDGEGGVPDVIAEPIVGRGVELEAVARALAELQHGRPAMLEVVGEAGIGKTRFLAELAARADALGYLVLTGSASELERDVPFLVFVDALDEYVESLGPSHLDVVPADVRNELATIFPSLLRFREGENVAVQQERFRSHRAVRELLELLASPRPLVLILDDLHWSDPGSVELLSVLLRRPPSAAVLVAFSLRPRQVPERLLSPLERAEREGLLTRLELEALTVTQAQELLGEGAGPWLSDLYEQSGGNPFYLEQLARRGKPDVRIPGRAIEFDGVDVPPAVAAALSGELALLSEEARHGLDGAAVAGDPFEPELAAAAADVSQSAFVEVLDELLSVDLIRPTDVPRRFRFRHPLVRRVIYELSPVGWRIGAHERCATALAVRGASPVLCAHHVEWSAHHGDLAAVVTLKAAGEAAQQRTPESAARWFAAALRLLPSSDSSEERIELLLARAGALAAAGRFAESHSTLVDTMSALAPEETIIRARLTARCARLGHLLLRRVEARKRLVRALAEVRDSDSPEAVSLMLALAVESYYDVDASAVYSWAGRALDAKELAPAGLRANALALRALGAALAGVDADACLSEAEAFVDGLADDDLEDHLDALAHLGTAEFYYPRYRAAVGHVERALAIGRATGQGDLFPSLYPVLASALGRLGRIAEAVDVADAALELARLLNNPHQIAWGLINRAYIALVAGDLDFALPTSEEARAVAEQLDGSLISLAAAHVHARTLLAMGEGAAAAEILQDAAGGPSIAAQTPTSRVTSLLTLTRCLLSAGLAADAEQAAIAAVACADKVGRPLALANAELAQGFVDLHFGRSHRAEQRAFDALTTFESLDDAYSVSVARVLRARALAADGRQGDAVREFERAAAIFDSWGAVRYRDEVERELRKLGRRIHRRTMPGAGDSGVEALTKRELEVATLVSDGKSNPQIAADLFLSQKTVESHLRNIFHKLDVSSRLNVARALDRATPMQESATAGGVVEATNSSSTN